MRDESLASPLIVKATMPHADISIDDDSWNGADHHYDLSVAATAIGYSPRTSLVQGLRENIAQIQRRLPVASER